MERGRGRDASAEEQVRPRSFLSVLGWERVGGVGRGGDGGRKVGEGDRGGWWCVWGGGSDTWMPFLLKCCVLVSVRVFRDRYCSEAFLAGNVLFCILPFRFSALTTNPYGPISVTLMCFLINGFQGTILSVRSSTTAARGRTGVEW